MTPVSFHENLRSISEAYLKKPHKAFISPAAKSNKLVAIIALSLLASQGVNATVLTNSPDSCSITAWIGTEHGFIDFKCHFMQETIGFYPQEATLKNTLSSGINSAVNMLAIYKIYQNPLTILEIPSNLELPSVPAIVKDDNLALLFCLHDRVNSPCMKAKIDVDYGTALQAYQKVEAVRNATVMFQNGKCPKDPNDHPGSYKFINQNCIDFINYIMDSTGVTNWKDQMTYTTSPSTMEKAMALAWHYYNYLT